MRLAQAECRHVERCEAVVVGELEEGWGSEAGGGAEECLDGDMEGGRPQKRLGIRCSRRLRLEQGGKGHGVRRERSRVPAAAGEQRKCVKPSAKAR